MLYDTELKKKIITNKTAEYIVDNLSPVYGEDYVGLNIINTMGVRLGDLIKFITQLGYEGTPFKATWSLDYWEDSLDLPRDPKLNTQQRRDRIINYRLTRFSSNPWKLNKIIKDFTGQDNEIIENTDEYTFSIAIEMLDGLDFKKLIAALEEINSVKPAHIIYKLILRARQAIYYGLADQRRHKVTIYPNEAEDQTVVQPLYFAAGYYAKKIKTKDLPIEVWILDEYGMQAEVTGYGGERLKYDRDK